MASGRRRAAALAVATALLAGCTGGGSTSLRDPDDIPPRQKGPPTDVSVCQLVPASQASSTLGRPLRVVGVGYGPSRVPTFRCLLGDEFGVAELTVELAVGPVARNVFADAYGDRAGGDPRPVRHLGGSAYLRNEKDQVSLHVFVRGSILSLLLVRDPARPVPRRVLVGLARAAVGRMPGNPQLAPTSAGPRCASVPIGALAAVVGVRPTRAAGLEAEDGSVTCSWASLPGSVDVTVIRDPQRVRDYRRTLDRSDYIVVPGVGGRGATALSRANRPGDVLLFVGHQSMALIAVTPSAGYPSDSIVTTPTEVALAREVVTRLM